MALGQIFSKHTQAIFYNWKQNPVQRMLDFDFLCGTPFCVGAVSDPNNCTSAMNAGTAQAGMDNTFAERPLTLPHQASDSSRGAICCCQQDSRTEAVHCRTRDPLSGLCGSAWQPRGLSKGVLWPGGGGNSLARERA